MKYLLLLFPLMVIAQPNFSITSYEYRRRVDNIFNLREILLDQNLRGIDIQSYKDAIVNNKDLAGLQALEALEQVKRNEKEQRENNSRNLFDDKYLAQKYIRNLNVNSLTTEEKKQEFFSAVKTLLESYQ